MTDTPQHIDDIQLSHWFSKTPGERLRQFLVNNDAMLQALKQVKKNLHPADIVENLPFNGIPADVNNSIRRTG
jgi:hypothetical protein